LWNIEADELQIGQVINNLVINASQAMSGSGTVTVAVENRIVENRADPSISAGKYVVVTVSDLGAGIPAEHLPRIFDPYFTTKDEGSGLGLAISYSIVKNHGGIISVLSEPERGSTFMVYLPATEAAVFAQQHAGEGPGRTARKIMNRAGSRLKRPRNPMPGFVKGALALMNAFRGRPPYQQNDYLGWISRAKQPATQQKRLDQMLDELERGDVYMKMASRQKRKEGGKE
jgi:hypothetical protein